MKKGNQVSIGSCRQMLMAVFFSMTSIFSSFSNASESEKTEKNISEESIAVLAKIESQTKQVAQLNQEIIRLRAGLGDYQASLKTGRRVRNIGLVIFGAGLLGFKLSQNAILRHNLDGIVGAFFSAIAMGGGALQAIGGELYVVIEDRNLSKLDEALLAKQTEMLDLQNELNLLKQTLQP